MGRATASQGVQVSATSEDCPCCHGRLVPGEDTDRAFVIAFIGGVTARDQNVPIGEALCAKHAAFARECIGFVNAATSGAAS